MRHGRSSLACRSTVKVPLMEAGGVALVLRLWLAQFVWGGRIQIVCWNLQESRRL